MMNFSKISRTTLLSMSVFSTGVAWAEDDSLQKNQPLSNPANISGVSAEVCMLTNEGQIRNLFNRWNDSLKTLDPAKVTANYASDAVLLPTVSNTPRTNHAEINDYFVHFLDKKPQGVINKSYVKIGCNKAYDVGVYTFALSDKAGHVQHVKARYSFMYEFKDGQWLISHHHSSAMPEKITAKPH